MKRMTCKKTSAHGRRYRRLKASLVEYITLMDKMINTKTDFATSPEACAMRQELVALKAENKKLRTKRPSVIRINNVSINTLVTKH